MRIGALIALAGIAPVASAGPATVVAGAGAAGFSHNEHVQETVAIASAEYRSGYELFWGVRPLAGAFGTSDGGGYAHAGLYRDFQIGARWILTPHLSMGAFGKGAKTDLGGTFEIQTGIDLRYRLESGWSVGVTLRHVSNAGTGSSNPGIEMLGVIAAMALR